MVCEFTSDWSKEIEFIRSVALMGKIEEAIELANTILNSSAKVDSLSRNELENIISPGLAEQIMISDVGNVAKRAVLEYELGI